MFTHTISRFFGVGPAPSTQQGQCIQWCMPFRARFQLSGGTLFSYVLGWLVTNWKLGRHKQLFEPTAQPTAQSDPPPQTTPAAWEQLPLFHPEWRHQPSAVSLPVQSTLDRMALPVPHPKKVPVVALTAPPSPSCLQTTLASFRSQPLSQTVPKTQRSSAPHDPQTDYHNPPNG